MTYKPGKASQAELDLVVDDMQRVIMRAFELSEVDFSVVETRRSRAQQELNIKNKVSWTMDSDHIPNGADEVLAADIFPWRNGETSHSDDDYNLVAKAMFRAAGELGVELKWGGFWLGERRDTPHWAKRRGT